MMKSWQFWFAIIGAVVFNMMAFQNLWVKVTAIEKDVSYIKRVIEERDIYVSRETFW